MAQSPLNTAEATQPGAPELNPTRRISFPLLWALALQFALAAPYLLVLALAPPGRRFVGLIYNPDDPFVYLSWMRQAADGHWLLHNLFTLEPQRGLSFHLLLLVLGKIAAITGLPLIVIYHLCRALLGVV